MHSKKDLTNNRTLKRFSSGLRQQTSLVAALSSSGICVQSKSGHPLRVQNPTTVIVLRFNDKIDPIQQSSAEHVCSAFPMESLVCESLAFNIIADSEAPSVEASESSVYVRGNGDGLQV